MSITSVENLLAELELKGALGIYKTYSDDPSKLDNTPATVLLEAMLLSELNDRRMKREKFLLRTACIPQWADATDIQYDQERDDKFKDKMGELLSLDFVQRNENVTIFGNAGSGKSFIACVLARMNCLNGHSTYFSTTSSLIAQLRAVKGSVSYRSKLRQFTGKTLLIMDDFCLTEYSPDDKEILFDVLDGRQKKKSTIIISQKVPELWLEVLGKDALAESIVDRASSNNHKLVLKGKSRRASID